MKLPKGDAAQNERNRQLEKADSENVKRDRDNFVSGMIKLQSPNGTWWALTVDDSGNVTAI